MIIEALFSWSCAFWQVLFSAFQLFDIPLNLIEVLADILCYGVWIVGFDLVSIIMANVVYWLTMKYVIGMCVWFWRLLPFT